MACSEILEKGVFHFSWILGNSEKNSGRKTHIYRGKKKKWTHGLQIIEVISPESVDFPTLDTFKSAEPSCLGCAFAKKVWVR